MTCVVPVRDGERFLAAALESSLGQTHPTLEVIVVDDGSTDSTAEIVRSYEPRVRYVRQDNAGPAAARNRGIELAHGDFLTFLDADDLWHPEKVERQLRRFVERPELGVCFARLRNFLDGTDPRQPGESAEDVAGYTSQTMLARRDLFQTVGLLDPTLGHGDDRDWLLRAAEQGIVMDMLGEVLVYRRLHGANRSRALGAQCRADYLRIVKASLDRRRAQGQPAEYGFGSERQPKA